MLSSLNEIFSNLHQISFKDGSNVENPFNCSNLNEETLICLHDDLLKESDKLDNDFLEEYGLEEYMEDKVHSSLLYLFLLHFNDIFRIQTEKTAGENDANILGYLLISVFHDICRKIENINPNNLTDKLKSKINFGTIEKTLEDAFLEDHSPFSKIIVLDYFKFRFKNCQKYDHGILAGFLFWKYINDYYII